MHRLFLVQKYYEGEVSILKQQSDLKASILKFLDERPVPQSLSAVCERFKSGKGETLSLLDAAVEAGEIFRTKKDKYTSLRNAGVLRGTAVVRFGAPVFIRPEAGSMDYYLGNTDWLMNGDTVLIQPLDASEKPRCSLVRILRRAVTQLPATVEIETHPVRQKKKQKQPPKPHVTAVAYPLDSRIASPIRLRVKSLEGVRSGDIAMVRIVRYPEPNQETLGEITEVFGREDDLEAIVQSILAVHEIPRAFDEAALQEADHLLDRISDADMEGREDLRGETVITIDGADAKDFDDAVSLKKTGSGWDLGVHIADVSHYVRHGSAIDAAALERGTSVYMPGLTIPMLPEQLCNDRCSLLPEEDRLTLSVLMQLAPDGRVTDYRITPSVIHSRARLTYEQVNRMLSGQEDHNIPPQLCPMLRDMNALKDKMAALRSARGAIELDLPEARITVGKRMIPTAVILRERGESERMIEQFMLAANECAAEFARQIELPFLYRVHDEPDSERLGAVNDQLSAIGCALRLAEQPRPIDVAAVLNAIREHPSAIDIRRQILLAMSKARYAPTPDGHFALAAQDYCHFTSPIRRYPDLFIHRMIKRYLAGQPHAHLDVHALASQCSRRETEAALAERETDKMLMAAYMARQIGRRFDARVTRITRSVIFVSLENTIEGAVTPYYMSERYAVDEQRRYAEFIPSGRKICLGDTVRVRVENAIPATGEIEFSLVEPE